jgi:hypothetical protein
VVTHARSAAALALLAALSATAAAQAPPPPELTAAALEQQVPDELASEGVVLASHGLRLQIKPVGDKWLVSLVAVSTGRPVTSTRVDLLPADRDAAVAVMTDVVANLVAHALEASAPAPATALPSAPAVAPPAAPAPTPAPPSQAELAYQRQALRFAAVYDIDDRRGAPSVQHQWLVFQGDPGRSLSAEEFYHVLGRDDLADAYRARRGWRIAGGITAVLGLSTAVVLGIASLDHGCIGLGCSSQRPDYVAPMLASFGIGLAGFMVLHVKSDPPAVNETNARTLADAYNQRLRARLGLPPHAMHRAPIRDIALVPIVASGDRGLVLCATF